MPPGWWRRPCRYLGRAVAPGGGDGDDAGRDAERGSRGDRRPGPAADFPPALPGGDRGGDRRVGVHVGGVVVQQVPDDVLVGKRHWCPFHTALSEAVKMAASPGWARRWAMAREAVLLTVPVVMPSSLATSSSLRSSK